MTSLNNYTCKYVKLTKQRELHLNLIYFESENIIGILAYNISTWSSRYFIKIICIIDFKHICQRSWPFLI